MNRSVDELMRGSRLKAICDKLSEAENSGSQASGKQAAAKEWDKLGKELLNLMCRLVSQTPDMIIRPSPYKLPNRQLAPLKLISTNTTWIYELSIDDRNALECLIDRFDTFGFVNLNNLNHTSLANNFALIIAHGKHTAILSARLQNAYSRWMNAAGPDVTVNAFYEYCYLPVRQSMQAAELDNNYKQQLLNDWHLFASMGVRGWPQMHATAWRQDLPPQFSLNPRKMLQKVLRVQEKKAHAIVAENPFKPIAPPAYLQEYENWVQINSSRMTSSDQPQLYNAYMNNTIFSQISAKTIEERAHEIEVAAKDCILRRRKQEEAQERALFRRAFKSMHPALKYDANASGLNHFWGYPQRNAQGNGRIGPQKAFQPTYRHRECRCDACVAAFGVRGPSRGDR